MCVGTAVSFFFAFSLQRLLVAATFWRGTVWQRPAAAPKAVAAVSDWTCPARMHSDWSATDFTTGGFSGGFQGISFWSLRISDLYSCLKIYQDIQFSGNYFYKNSPFKVLEKSQPHFLKYQHYFERRGPGELRVRPFLIEPGNGGGGTTLFIRLLESESFDFVELAIVITFMAFARRACGGAGCWVMAVLHRT